MDFRAYKGPVAVFSLVFILAGAASEASTPLRLIKHKDKVKWMPLEDAIEISIDSHNSGHCGGFMDLTAFANQPQYSSVNANSLDWTALSPDRIQRLSVGDRKSVV